MPFLGPQAARKLLARVHAELAEDLAQSRVRSQELVEGDRNRSDAATSGVVDTVRDSGGDADQPNLANALGTEGRERIRLPDEDDIDLRRVRVDRNEVVA